MPCLTFMHKIIGQSPRDRHVGDLCRRPGGGISTPWKSNHFVFSKWLSSRHTFIIISFYVLSNLSSLEPQFPNFSSRLVSFLCTFKKGLDSPHFQVQSKTKCCDCWSWSGVEDASTGMVSNWVWLSSLVPVLARSSILTSSKCLCALTCCRW